MGIIQREAASIGWDINTKITNAAESLINKLNGVIGGVKANFNSIMNYDTVGIVYSEVPNMQKAIDEYVNALQKHMEEVRRDADASKAMRGDYQTDIRDFVDAVCEAVDAVISYLLQFRDKLSTGYGGEYSEEETVLGAYKKKDEDLQASIKQQAGDLRSQHQAYGSTGTK